MKRVLICLCLFFSLNAIAQLDSLEWESIQRTYLVHLPAGFDGSEDLPLVIAMHGGFGSANNLQNQSQLSVKSDEENFIVVYPEGVQGGVFDIRTWNAGWCCGHASATNIDDVGFINTLLDTLIMNYPIDINRIYATGMSNGGFMSYRLACELSDRIAAIAPVAASMTMLECNPDRAVPVMDFHSYLDFNVPYQGGVGSGPSTHYSPPIDSILSVWSQFNDCMVVSDTITNNTQFMHVVWSDCDCNYQIEQYVTQDGGHSWPGGQATPLGDPTSNFINATDLMWDFLSKYSLDCIDTSTKLVEEKNDLFIYPNPTNRTINFEINNNLTNLKIAIYNTLGVPIFTTRENRAVDVSQLLPGTYIAKVAFDGKQIWRKFIKGE